MLTRLLSLRGSLSLLERLADAAERLADCADEQLAIQRQLHPLPQRSKRQLEMGVATVEDFNIARQREHNAMMGGTYEPGSDAT